MRSLDSAVVRTILVPVGLVLAGVQMSGPTLPDPEPARRGDHVDTHHGVRMPDPYRWLEEMDAPETRRWVEDQDRRARDFAGKRETRAALRDEVALLASVRRYRPPWKRGGRYFYLTYQSSGGPGTPGTQLHVSGDIEGGRGADRTLLGQEELPEGTVLTRIAPGPRGRFVVYGVAREASRWETLSLGSAQAGGALAWRDVVAEGSEAINTWLGARMVGRHLIVGYLVDARTEVRVFDLDGRPLYTLELPRLGPIWSGFQPSVGADETETFYSLSGLVDPGSIYRLDLETGRSTLFARPDLRHDPEDFVTRQVFYAGRDGTRIPMYLVHRRGLERNDRAPVIVYGYGFGGWSAAPWFQPHLAVWLRMGGIWALPNIRGGGEYGDAWHRAGSGRHKQTAIDDYLAAAEWLIEEGYTSPGLLVANASSAGGAVGGGALVQRPELFGAAVLDYPVLDLLRYDRFTGGRSWRSEYGTVEDPDDFEALLAYSPYHNIRLHRCYPPTLVSPGELDEVTPPLHAYKFVAALQYAQGCGEPILLRVTWGAGHSSGATVEDAVETWTDQLSFLVQVLRRSGWQPAISE